MTKFIPTIQDISNAYQVVRSAESALKEAKDEWNYLRDYAARNCQHEFTTPPRGFEHAGGVCVKCGTGELHYLTMFKGK